MRPALSELGLCPTQAFAGIVTVSVGHCHPKVVDAIVKQLQRVQHTTTIYLNEQIALFAKELAETLPGNLKVRAPLWQGTGWQRPVTIPRRT